MGAGAAGAASSFLPQAVRATAAISVAIRIDLFILNLNFLNSTNYRELRGPSELQSPNMARR